MKKRFDQRVSSEKDVTREHSLTSSTTKPRLILTLVQLRYLYVTSAN
uniref:Uncharacterized protein n=1 Tax=Anguilla anguilla TaxID=7936 RepID=A0A0E9XFL7_ANGAN